jgi:hypothetical protein
MRERLMFVLVFLPQEPRLRRPTEPAEKKESIETIYAHREVPNPALVVKNEDGIEESQDLLLYYISDFYFLGTTTTLAPTAANPAKIREFYVKWTGRSYMHAEWLTEQKLVSSGFKKKMRNYLEKKHHDISEIEESEMGNFFPQEFLEVDRIIGMQPREVPRKQEQKRKRERGERLSIFSFLGGFVSDVPREVAPAAVH